MVKPEPQVMTRATASPGPATGSGISTSSKGVFGARNTMAFMSVPSTDDRPVDLHPLHGDAAKIAPKYGRAYRFVRTAAISSNRDKNRSNQSWVYALPRCPQDASAAMVERKGRHRRGQGIGIVALARSRTRIATVGSYATARHVESDRTRLSKCIVEARPRQSDQVRVAAQSKFKALREEWQAKFQ